MNNDIRIGVIGLGYVGLPLACLFSEKYMVTGFDLSETRIRCLREGNDTTGEIEESVLLKALSDNLSVTSDPGDLKSCNVYIVAVPTPVNESHRPDLTCLRQASVTVGGLLKKGDTVIFESTVNPGATEETCAPIMEELSGLRLNEDYWLGYSPERINPGDKVHTVKNICKITSGSCPEALEFIDTLYNSVLEGGTYRASCIRVAEAAKIMENTQRDINIAFMNEMAIVLRAMDIDVNEVIDAASSKWNFLRFHPGLVGGHCISVDPYYLIELSKKTGVYPRLISEARRVNDSMGVFSPQGWWKRWL